MQLTRRRMTARELGICLLALVAAILLLTSRPMGVEGQGSMPVTTVSAASFTGQLAPEAIAASFGANLATQTLAATGGQLPTTLGGTTLQVNGQAAQLFFVSPNQVNFLVPAGVGVGTATVTITAGNGVVSTGTAIIGQSAPGVFTLNASGEGLPAAYLLRIRPGNVQIQEPINQPINFGPPEDRIFLVLFLTGLRSGGAVQVHIGGAAFTPDFVGPAPGFVGLEQINLELSRTLAGRGQLPLFVTVNGALFSNVVDVDFLGSGPPQITSFAPGQTLAGDELTINGAGFSAAAGDNRVAILDQQGNPVWAQVTSATANQLKVRVPYGAQSGMVLVSTPQGEVQSGAPLAMRTSVSGFLEQVVIQNGVQVRQPAPPMTVRLRPATGAIVTRQSNPDGSFLFGDVSTGLALIDVDPIANSLPYPSMRLKMPVTANRDNQYPNAVELTQVQGNSLPVNAGQNGGAMTTIINGNLATNFGLPDGCQVFQPPNTSTNSLTISLFQLARTPLTLPVGTFSSAIAQVSPFGARMQPGGTLRLPNPDGLITDRPHRLYRLDQPTLQISEPPTVGEFVEVGIGNIINDGRIEAIETGQTATNGITQTTYYFVSPIYPLASVSGRVLGSDGEPISRAVVRSRGQSTFTASDGRFTLQNVPVIRNNNDSVTLDVSYVRPDGAVDRTEFGPVGVTANGNATIGADITLSGRLSADQPLLIAPPRLTVNQNQTLDFTFLAFSQPQPGQVVAVAATGAAFATVTGQGNGVFTLRLAPGTATVGTYLMRLTVTSGSGVKYLLTIPVRVRAPGNQPTADDQSLLTAVGTARNVTLIGRDPQGRSFSLSLASSPANGTLSGVNPNLIYTPRAGFTGIDSFTYRAVVPGAPVSETATVYVIVR